MPEDAAFTSSETLRALLKNKMAIKLDEIAKIGSVDLQYDEEDDLERKQAQDPALGHLLANVTSLALGPEQQQQELAPNVISSLSLYPKLEDFTKKIIERRYNEEISKSKPPNSRDDVHSLCNLNGLDKDNHDQHISIPSYEPAANHLLKQDLNLYENEKPSESSQRTLPNTNSVNFKEMIAHYIGQKAESIDVKDNAVRIFQGEESLLSAEKLSNIATHSVSQATPSSSTKDKRGNGKKRTGSPLTSGGKGSRPKRGKYRNYDRENLIKAVQAVQSGEMSVHRAGSFYGVPHSTLEYKVKERHLNRGRAKKDNNTATSDATSTTKNLTSMPSRPTMVPTSSFGYDKPMITKETTRPVVADATTIDLTDEEVSSIRENAMSDTYHVAKKMKLDINETDEEITSPSQSQANPFNLWSSSNSLLPSFTPIPYEHDPFYASRVMRKFQELQQLDSEAAITRFNATSRISKEYSMRNASLSPLIPNSENGSPIHGHSSGSCSPNLEKDTQSPDCDSSTTKNSVLDALLRGKSPMEPTSVNSNSPQSSSDLRPTPWSVSSRLLNLSKQLAKVQDDNLGAEPSPASKVPSGLTAFNALCNFPSMLGIQNSIAAALNRQISPTEDTLQKESPDVGNQNTFGAQETTTMQSPLTVQSSVAEEENLSTSVANSCRSIPVNPNCH